MADTAINAAPSRRFHNGGTLRITTDPGGSPTDYALGMIQPGGVTYNRGGRAKSVEMDENQQLTGNILPGAERPSSITVNVKATKDGLTSTDDLLDIVREAVDSTTGMMVVFDIEIEELDAEGASTGYRGLATNCVLDTESFAVGGGDADPDTLNLTFMAADKDITWSTF